MNDEPKTESLETRRRACRNGKIARLPHLVREELNQRLLDGESGRSLVEWLNALPETKAALEREFGGGVINEQNVSDWKHGGFRDWMAKNEADEFMAETLAQCTQNGTTAATDQMAAWFFPYYVAAARGQMSEADTSAERWSVLRAICADLGNLRRNDHYVERLRLWREKLRIETEEDKTTTEDKVIAWVRAHPEVEVKIWPDRKQLSPEEKEQRVCEILGITRAAQPDDEFSGKEDENA